MDVFRKFFIRCQEMLSSHLKKASNLSQIDFLLRHRPEKRTSDELKIIYEEIIHIKPIVHLSDSVRYVV